MVQAGKHERQLALQDRDRIPESEKARTKYADIAKQIEREDGLVDRRIVWLLTFEGLAFAAYGLMVSKAAELAADGQRLAPDALLLVGCAIMVLGAEIASKTGETLQAAHEQMAYLRQKYLEDPIFREDARWIRPFHHPGNRDEVNDLRAGRVGGWFPRAFVTFCLGAAFVSLLALLLVHRVWE